jgi:hypothetical protein
LQCFPSTTSTGPSPQARRGRRSGRRYRRVLARTRRPLPMLGSWRAPKRSLTSSPPASRPRPSSSPSRRVGWKSWRYEIAGSGPSFARRRLRTGDGGVTARRRPRDLATLPLRTLGAGLNALRTSRQFRGPAPAPAKRPAPHRPRQRGRRRHYCAPPPANRARSPVVAVAGAVAAVVVRAGVRRVVRRRVGTVVVRRRVQGIGKGATSDFPPVARGRRPMFLRKGTATDFPLVARGRRPMFRRKGTTFDFPPVARGRRPMFRRKGATSDFRPVARGRRPVFTRCNVVPCLAAIRAFLS